MKLVLAALGILTFSLAFRINAASTCPPVPPRGLNQELKTGFPTMLGADVRKTVVDTIQSRIANQYFDIKMANVNNQTRIKAALEAKSERAFYDVLRAWLKSLDADTISYLRSPKTLATDQTYFQGPFVGIGVQLGRSSQNYLVVTNVFANGGASKAGIRVQDRILSVNGDPCPRLENLRGPENSSVTVRVQSAGGPARNLTIKRVRIDPPADIPLQSKRYRNMGYIWMAWVPSEAVLSAALKKLLEGDALEGIILDLRNTDISSGQEIQTLLAHFMPGVLYYFSTRTGRSTNRASPRDPEVLLPMAVLHDVNTLQSGPMVLGVLKSRAKTLFVGSNTLSDPRAGATETLPDGSELFLYSSRFVLEGDKELPKLLEPSVVVNEDWFAFKQADDPYIKTALKSLSTLK
jgi:carboxyl-terminal processing protease